MTYRFIRCGGITAVAVAVGLVFTPLAGAQEGGAPARGAAPQGQPASVPTPRTPDGQPDLSGFWGRSGGGQQPDAEGNLTILTKSRGCHPGMVICTAPVNQSNDSTFATRLDANRPLYKPEYWAKVRDLDMNSNTVAPYLKCQPDGVPDMGPPTKILQTKDEVVFLYAQNLGSSAPADFRIIPIDGRPHDPVKSQDLLYYGDSVGTWEGDTLVVDSVGFNDLTWIGQGGYFHSDQMSVIERFTREGNIIRYQATVIDPVVLLEPWVMNPRVMRLNLDKKATIAEQNPCEERDVQHLVGKIRH